MDVLTTYKALSSSTPRSEASAVLKSIIAGEPPPLLLFSRLLDANALRRHLPNTGGGQK